MLINVLEQSFMLLYTKNLAVKIMTIIHVNVDYLNFKDN